MKKLLIVAGGDWQCPIIHKAKDMGLYVVNTNLYQDSPGFKIADVGSVADVLDVESNLEIARQQSVDAILTDQSDIAVPTVAKIADQLGLPGIGAEKAALFTNKHLMREFCAEKGFPIPPYKLCRDQSEAEDFINEHGFPCVVKPSASQSSRGVGKLTALDQLHHAFMVALEHSKDGTVLLEGFIGGVELTVDGIQLNAGDHHCLATSCKTHYEHNEMIANRLLFSQKHDTIDYDALHKQHNRMIEEMQLPFGLTHAEYKYFNGDFYLIEVAARGGGTRLSSDIVPLMSGVNSNELLIRMALGEAVSEVAPSCPEIVSVLDFFEFSPGRINNITGVERAKSLKGVIALGLSVKVGEVIHPAADDRSRHGFVIAYANTLQALESLLDEVCSTLQVQYE